VPVTDAVLPEDAAQLAARRASVSRQLDLILDDRGPVQLVRQLVADLDQISAELAQVLRGSEEPAQRAMR
jgi:chorismate-pyruvate lyase